MDFYFHPFRSRLYDYLEEMTGVTEFMVLLLGLLLTAKPEPDDWIEPFAWIFVALSLCHALFTLVVDLLDHVNERRHRGIR